MSSRIEDLDPDVQDMALDFLQHCAREGITLRVTQSYRTLEEQAALYAQGRTAPGPIVTHAPPGYSFHNFGRAFDVCQMGATPYPDPDTTAGRAWWEMLGTIGEHCGLEWGGRWKHPDRPHFEHHGGSTLAALRLKAEDEGLLA